MMQNKREEIDQLRERVEQLPPEAASEISDLQKQIAELEKRLQGEIRLGTMFSFLATSTVPIRWITFPEFSQGFVRSTGIAATPTTQRWLEGWLS